MDDIDQVTTGCPEVTSTSSTPSDTSLDDDRLAKLGERILTELGETQTNSTLTRWLAHHVAGLMDTADRARAAGSPDADARQAEARSAILQLWQHRTDWPYGWPPPKTVAIARLLERLPEIDNPGWQQLTLLGRIQDLHYRVLSAVLDFGAARSVDIEREWLRIFGDQLSTDEIALLTHVAAAPRRVETLVRWVTKTADNEDVEPNSEQAGDPKLGEDRSVDVNGRLAIKDPRIRSLVTLADAYREAVIALSLKVSKYLADTTGNDGG
ncbi:hypothetical protein [Amycolatopsis thailandensis]|uniref:hypothetical protein n=1 Tax=Amycolatopsis thailandensis TaxID=589330 RepID=UPI003642857E